MQFEYLLTCQTIKQDRDVTCRRIQRFDAQADWYVTFSD